MRGLRFIRNYFHYPDESASRSFRINGCLLYLQQISDENQTAASTEGVLGIGPLCDDFVNVFQTLLKIFIYFMSAQNILVVLMYSRIFSKNLFG